MLKSDIALSTKVKDRRDYERDCACNDNNAIGDIRDNEIDNGNDTDECSCDRCSKWNNQTQLFVSSTENTYAEKCDPDWTVQYGEYPTSLGALCEVCAGRPLLDGTCCRHIAQETSSTLGSLDTSFHSFAGNCSTRSISREISSERLCRICHCPSTPDDQLISPCRCSGTLQFVHMSCLLHWLSICSRKLKRPPICELCLYKYRKRRTFKLRNIRLPSIPRRDLGYLAVFIIAVTLMFISAAMSFVCFYIERKFGIVKKNETCVFIDPFIQCRGF
ncbi:unnamed protein product [Anisakis simplex]|uniref:RING-CH-type domain-containing protein n=1 Tax=Anisakis simplex TaxID=6269 RepID=A0A0M3J3L4_ANISI|nr:unnamed protein product [Anisakis simplex]